MSPVIRKRRRIAAALVGLLVIGLAIVLAGRGSAVHAEQALGPVGIEAQIGPGNGAILLGPASQSGTAGETWALSTGDTTVPQPKTVDGQELPVTKQYVLRYRPAEGWRYVQAPLDEQGRPYAGTIADGRVTARGGLLLAGTDTTRPDGAQRTILVRDADGPTRVAAAPGPGVLKPRQGSEPAETLSASALAARAGGDGRTEGFVAITGPALATGVARWDGESWSREPICVAEDGSTPPPGCAAGDTLDDAQFGLTPVALATVEGGDAWLLARAHDDAHRGLVLFRRDGTSSGSGARWRLHDLGAPRFAADATPADAITAVAPLAGGHAATATTDGVWLDGSFQQNGSERSVTLKVSASGPTRSWCDGGLCDAPLGFALRTDGRSQAWAGNGPGSRVVGPVGSGPTRYASFDGDAWTVSAAFGTAQNGVAFSSLGEGWIGDVHLTRDRPSSPLAAWSIPVRRPLTAIAAVNGAAGDTATPALAVGIEGNVLRYSPGQGWDSEVRLTASGVSRDNLRGVAWPEPSTAFAVGDEGAMWRWRKATGLWESDPAAPFDFTGHLTGVAFQPGNPDRGFAVGRDGVLLQYGKSWQQVPLPAELESDGPGGGKADLYAVAFAGSQALAAAGKGGVIVENGGGWSVDEGVKALLARSGNGGSIVAVAGLPDGGAVAAGTSGDRAAIVLERDGPDGPWRFSDQPLPAGVIAASAFREDGRVRALVSVSPTVWPTVADLQLPPSDPSSPAPRRTPFGLPVDGYLMRETALGWRDEERTKLDGPTTEKPRKSDPVLALLGDGAGRSWTVGGWSGGADLLGRGNTEPGPLDVAQTASVSRYDPAGPQGSSNVTVQTPTMEAGRARLLVGGHAQCADACADLAPVDTMPDRTLSRAVGLANQLGTAATGPRAFVYTGGRIAGSSNVPASNAEALRYAGLLMGGGLPTFPALAAGDATGGSSSAFESAFAGYSAPLGNGAAAAGTSPVPIGAAATAGHARTHYAVDIATTEGVVRLVVIDNASGSLALRNDVGNPVEDQGAWLAAVLADAKANRIATVVSGNRSLDPRDPGGATDGTAVAVLLRDGGASAYVYDGRGEQRRGAIPAGSTVTIPSYASGSLGYRAEGDLEGRGVPGLLLLELDLAHRDATTNRAPAGVRLIPVIDDLALEAVDGRLLNRSTPALFEGLGRRPRAGGNWTLGASTTEGNGADPYVTFPSPICAVLRREACAQTRLDPDVRFHSSDPDIADFVRVDPTSTNPRKPYVDPATDKPVPDASSGLVCPFNAGTTTISIEAGGLRYQTTVTVRAGSVLRPCGTVPLNPSRFPAANGSASPPPPPPAPPGSTPSSTPAVAPPPVPVAAPIVAPPAPVTPAAVVPPVAKPLAAIPAALPAFIAPILNPPLAVPPPPAAASPAPPPGTSGASINVPVSQPVTQAERQKDEEVAEESSKAYARYDPMAASNQGSGPGDGAAIVAAVLLAAIGGGTALGTRRRQRTPYVYARETARLRDPERRNRRPR